MKDQFAAPFIKIEIRNTPVISAFSGAQKPKSLGVYAMSGHGQMVLCVKVLVVPMRINGLWELKKADRHFAWPGEVSVIIGEPVYYSPQQDPQAIVADLTERVTGLDT
jgi:1-acyl-sn-glycerol-3-phosphate acyltransferase